MVQEKWSNLSQPPKILKKWVVSTNNGHTANKKNDGTVDFVELGLPTGLTWEINGKVATHKDVFESNRANGGNDMKQLWSPAGCDLQKWNFGVSPKKTW